MLKTVEHGYLPAQVGIDETCIVNAMGGQVPNYGDADRWFRLAAMQGDAEAEFWLGAGYERGLFGAVDYRGALGDWRGEYLSAAYSQSPSPFEPRLLKHPGHSQFPHTVLFSDQKLDKISIG
jgi:TPR repeat protein